MTREQLLTPEARFAKLPIMTVEELSKYNGKNAETNNKSYVAIKDLVFDVSASQHY